MYMYMNSNIYIFILLINMYERICRLSSLHVASKKRLILCGVALLRLQEILLRPQSYFIKNYFI